MLQAAVLPSPAASRLRSGFCCVPPVARSCAADVRRGRRHARGCARPLCARGVPALPRLPSRRRGGNVGPRRNERPALLVLDLQPPGCAAAHCGARHLRAAGGGAGGHGTSRRAPHAWAPHVWADVHRTPSCHRALDYLACLAIGTAVGAQLRSQHCWCGICCVVDAYTRTMLAERGLSPSGKTCFRHFARWRNTVCNGA
mmetsp:Transcript_9873/g.31304  ORF Transcript_9873/g.31304 Transcript_9873/m.31304 type:complete len:200 (+) Transcript_9873:491-1090(+)